MQLYKFIDTNPYDDSAVTNPNQALSPGIFPADHRVICLVIRLDEEGLDKPDTPCVIIDRSINKVVLPDGKIWNFGGVARINHKNHTNLADEDNTVVTHHTAESLEQFIAQEVKGCMRKISVKKLRTYLIWRLIEDDAN